MKYNSFSQLKGLTWFKNYRNIVDWERGETDELPPPIGATLDLTTACNFKCCHCNAAHSWELGLNMDEEEAMQIIDMLAEWGVKSICFAGGGEPTLHPAFPELVEHAAKSGLEVGISTNGSQLSKEKVWKSIVKYARFCGVSVDAAQAKTWAKIKNIDGDKFQGLLDNCELVAYKLTMLENINGVPLDFVFKFLIDEHNQDEIYTAAVLAKHIGFGTFFVRPAAVENVSGYKGKDINFNTKRIKGQIGIAKEQLHGNGINVYGSFNRVNKNFKRTFNFNKCHSTPLLLQICADGYWYLCIDHRYQEDFKLKKWDEIRGFWGSDEHREIVNSIDLRKCPRCAAGNYNEQIEKCVIKDYLFRKFP